MKKRAPVGAPAAWLANVPANPGTECLAWPFGKDSKGYGRITVGKKLGHAHRIICVKYYGVAPTTSHEVAHSCGNPGCVNPVHLRWATVAENAADRLLHGTHNRGEKHVSSKLTASDVLAIRAATGISLDALGAKYGVSGATVWNIKRRRKWAWLAAS